MPRNLLFLLLIILIKANHCFSQTNLRFTHYTTQDGLSNNIVTALFQDSRGLLWVGTSNGLNYFDGVSFQSIYPTDFDKVHLHSDAIFRLAEDADGNILILTDDGMEKYNWKAKTLKLIFPKSSDNAVADIITDKTHNIWILSNKYLQEYNPQWKLINAVRIDTLETKTDKVTFDIKFYCIDNDNNIWFHHHVTVCRWNAIANKLENKFNNYQYKKIFNLSFDDIVQDKKDNYWLLARGPKTKRRVLGYFNPESGSLKMYSLKNDYLLGFLRFSQSGKIWITSVDHGLFIFDTIKNKFEVIRHDDSNLNSPVDNFYEAIYKDKNGNFWLASQHGLDKCADVSNNFLALDSFGYDNPSAAHTKSEVTSIIAYKNNLLICTSGGFFKINAESLKQQYFKSNKKNYTLKDDYWLSCFLNSNTVLTSTWKGLFMYNVNQKQLHPLPFLFPHPALMDSVPVVSFFKDAQNNLWLGMQGNNGVYCWSQNINTFVKYDSHQYGNRYFPLRHFSCAAEDDSGNIWMGYDKGGMVIFNTGLRKFIQLSFAAFTILNQNGFHDIINDHRGNLWMSTGVGLFCYTLKTHQLKQYNRTDGLVSNIVTGMAFDKHGILWMGTYSGLSRLDTTTKHFTNFTIADGLTDDNIDQVIYDSVINKICFTTHYTVVLYNPDILSKQLPALSPIITSFYVAGNERNLNNNTVNLSYKENFFSFNYTAANFLNATDTRYQYRLEGFNKNWVNAGRRQYAGYTNLDGGNYVFKVRATNDGMHWYNMPAPVSIHISTPFYKTVWYYVLTSAVIITIIFLFVYFAYRAKLKRAVTALKIRNEIAGDLHDDVGSSLSSIMLMSELAKKTHEHMEDYFDNIKESAGMIIENMNDIVWAVNPNNDTMEQILIRMQSFASSLLEKKNIAFQFNADDALTTVKLSMEERKNFYLVFKEVVHNILKYAECNSVITQIKQQDKNILMTIKDNGKGFDTTIKYTGNGLKNISRRTKEINGKLEVISALNKGTVVTLAFKPTHKGS